MRECPEWLLGRVHRLKLAAKEARQRAEETDAEHRRLCQKLEDAARHIANATVPSGEMRQEVGERVEKRRAELTEQISALERQVEVAKGIADRAEEFSIATVAICERCSGWIDSGQHGDDDEFEAVDIVLSDDPATRVKEVEAEIANLIEEEERINAAPTAKVDIEAQVRSYVADLRTNCEPKVSVNEHGQVDIKLGAVGRKVDLPHYPSQTVTQQSLLALALWLDPDMVEQKLLEITDRIPAHKDAIPLDVKRRRLREIEGKRTAALYEMGALVRTAIETGTPVVINKEVQAEHVLGVRVAQRAAAAA